ncbi:hypothetical protein Tco_0910459 [Tanacetum coccineum]|uniref:Uncharacterized protein n=1 Tax=Tanacetum coccineum TaxID=301880 RepID=A0ABQ5CTV6_9ASTR
MLAIIISWFLVYGMSEAVKDMIEPGAHFILNLMDKGLSVLEWVEVGHNIQGDQECSCQPGRFVLDLGVEIELRRKMRMFEGDAFSHQPRTFHPSLGERSHDMVCKEMCIGCRTLLDGENMPIEASKKHSTGKHHYVIFDDANHPLGHVIGKAEEFSICKIKEHDQRSEVGGIGIDAFRKSGDRPFSGVHTCSFTCNMQDLGKLMQRKNDFIVSNDKGSGNRLVDISSDPNTLVELENK